MSGTAWDGPRFRPPPAAVLLVPVILSLIVQVPAAIVIAITTAQPLGLGILQVAIAALGPAALLAARRLPGPTVAVVAAAALADLLLAPDIGPPYLAIAFAIILAVARGALVWALASVGTVWLAAILLAPLAGVSWSPPRIAGTTAALAVCFAVGWFARTRRGARRRVPRGRRAASAGGAGGGAAARRRRAARRPRPLALAHQRAGGRRPPSP